MTLPEKENLHEGISDESDRATAIEMTTTQQLLLGMRSRMRRDQEPDSRGIYAETECSDCGGEIGEARLKVSIRNFFCIHCATLRERRR